MRPRLLLSFFPLFTFCISSLSCGPATVDMSARLRAAKLPDLESGDHGVRFDEPTKTIELTERPRFEASGDVTERLTVVPYHPLLWAAMKMPVIVGRAQDGRPSLVLFDTGLTPEYLCVTAD